MNAQQRRIVGLIAGIVIAAVVVVVIARARGGETYDLRFATAFSDAEGIAIIAAAVLATLLIAGVRWAVALLLAYLVLTLGVVHPCEIAFQDTPQPDDCSMSAHAAAIGLYAPLAAVACAAAAWAAARTRLSAPTAAGLLAAPAAALLGSLFGPWYDATDDGHSYSQAGWSAFQRLDVYLVIVVAAAGLLVAATLLGRPRRPRHVGHGVALLALSAAGLVFYRLYTAADPPSGGATPLPAMFVAIGLLVVLAFAALATAQNADE